MHPEGLAERSEASDINNNFVACAFLILTLFDDIVRNYAQDRPWDENQETTWHPSRQVLWPPELILWYEILP